MLDIIPSGPHKGKKQAALKKSKPDVVELTWKLPVRLRRPVSDEFRRRAVVTKRPAEWQRQMGVEHHTGDVYRNSRPEIRLPEPPYAGRFAKAGPAGLKLPLTRRGARPAAAQSRDLVVSGERDAPYQFHEGGDRKVEKIVLPLGRLSRRARMKSYTSFWKMLGLKRFGFNVAVLLAGCLLLYSLFWNLQDVGQSLARLNPVRERANQALGRVLSASGALAETDFAGSEQGFADAEKLLTEAQLEMDRTLTSSRAILRYLDVTGTVRSGQELLVAGEELARAGQHVSRGLAPLLNRSEGQMALVEVIGSAQEEFAQAVVALEQAQQALAHVDSPFLPQNVVDQVELLEKSVPQIKQALTAFLDQSGVLLTVLGVEREREYLLLFQNNHELRPTGGFIGSIALVNVDRGKVEKVAVQSVYDGDGQMRDFIAPPDPLLLVTNRWYLRDANWFVDWPVSAGKAAEFFEKEGGPTVDGVIAMTPEVVRGFLNIVGPIDMPQYGVTVTADNFLEVVQREVTYEYDKEKNKPKQFMADLTPVLLERLMKVPAGQSLEVIQALTNMMQRKDLLLYFRDEDVQERLAAAGWSGEVLRDKPGLLLVNNANIGGHKSDQFMEQEIDYRLSVQENGDVDVVTTIRRTHRGPEEALDLEYPKDENPAKKDNVVYQRVLVPKGAMLLEARGFATEADLPSFVMPEPDLALVVDPDLAEWQRGQIRHESGTMIGQEAGYTFFANWLVTKPGETSVVLYHYRLPQGAQLPSLWDPAKSFEAYVVKQPGQERTQVRVALRLPETTRIVHAVPAEGLTQHSNFEVAYRGELGRDVLVGAVFERGS